MKQIFDFIYCDGVITPNVIWYSVRVGHSVQDRRAKATLETLAASSSSYLFTRHTLAMAEFKERVAASLFPTSCDCGHHPVLLLRQKMVEVTWLVRFLKHNPAPLLNSERQVTCATHLAQQLFRGVSLLKSK